VQLTRGALGASLTVLGRTVGCAPLVPAPGAGAPAAGPDAAIWVYGAHRWTPDERETHLAHFATIARRLYLSVEDGPHLLVDEPDGARRLGELLDRATGHFRLAVEAMLLQDPSWVSDPVAPSSASSGRRLSGACRGSSAGRGRPRGREPRRRRPC
jgi:hypothetical protein